MRLVVVAGHSGFVSYFSAPQFSLQTLRHLHTCSGYFRLDRLPDDFHVIADPADIRALAELGISEHDRSSLTTDRMPASVSGINATPSLAHQTLKGQINPQQSSNQPQLPLAERLHSSDSEAAWNDHIGRRADLSATVPLCLSSTQPSRSQRAHTRQIGS